MNILPVLGWLAAQAAMAAGRWAAKKILVAAGGYLAAKAMSGVYKGVKGEE